MSPLHGTLVHGLSIPLDAPNHTRLPAPTPLPTLRFGATSAVGRLIAWLVGRAAALKGSGRR